MRFTLTIELGNDAMCTGEDIAASLHQTADRVEGAIEYTEEEDGSFTTLEHSGRPILDTNGNKVGSWAVSE